MLVLLAAIRDARVEEDHQSRDANKAVLEVAKSRPSVLRLWVLRLTGPPEVGDTHGRCPNKLKESRCV